VFVKSDQKASTNHCTGLFMSMTTMINGISF